MEKKRNVYIVDEDDFDPRDNIVNCVYGPPVTYFFKCKKCGHEWKSFMNAKKICPECGTKSEEFTSDE